MVQLPENRGTYVALNAGLRTARGEYLTTCGADDWVHPQRIERLVGRIRESGARAALAGWVRITDGGTVVVRPNGIVGHTDFSSLTVHRSVDEELGFFDRVRVSGDSEYRHRIESYYGSGSVVEARLVCLGLGRATIGQLTDTGPVAYDAFGFNRVRTQYVKLYRIWHRECKKRGIVPYVSDDSGSGRAFPAPAEVVGEGGHGLVRRVTRRWSLHDKEQQAMALKRMRAAGKRLAAGVPLYRLPLPTGARNYAAFAYLGRNGNLEPLRKYVESVLHWSARRGFLHS